MLSGVRPSVSLSQADIVSKRLNGPPCNQQNMVTLGLKISNTKYLKSWLHVQLLHATRCNSGMQ